MGSKARIAGERYMVRRATRLVLDVFRWCRSDCLVAHELTVGKSIADLVILRPPSACRWPQAPLSIAESAILSSLRRLGEARVDTIADDVYMRADHVRRILLGRLSTWLLVQGVDEGPFRSVTTWVARSEVIAVEAKLLRWRDALLQAAVYRRYADRAFVLLPQARAEIARRHKDDFLDRGVGLLSYHAQGVYQMISSPRVAEYTWHREFAISRMR